ncbi:MAG: formylglycine-generating enzyme family protein [Planctomyces sp.]|jgi:formylglycine-generating enzyme required for sulfatase activity
MHHRFRFVRCFAVSAVCFCLFISDLHLNSSLATDAATEIITNSIGMQLKEIPAGQFLMGAPETESGSRIDERPVHQVTISKAFRLGVYEVTQAEYLKVTATNPAYFSSTGDGRDKVKELNCDRLPVEQVSWDDAVAFCEKLSALPEEKAAGRVYRLPTEAEWQYSCRAGTDTPFHFGNAMGSSDANINGNFPYGGAPRGPFLGRTVPVGSYKPNAFGLYDMHGNVAELTADRYGRKYFEESPSVDPKGPENGNDRVVLGGSWGTDASRCRSAFRRSNATSGKAYYFGFRVACDLAGSSN